MHLFAYIRNVKISIYQRLPFIHEYLFLQSPFRNAWVAGSSPASGFKSERKISLKSKENQGFPAVWGDFFVVLGVKDE